MKMKRLLNLVQSTISFPKEEIKKLECALRNSFGVDTCYPAERQDWSKEIPSIGQCAVAALVVQEFLGGEIVYDQNNIHFWNCVDGIDIDLSRDQFPESVVIHESKIRERQELLFGPRAEAAETLIRYQILYGRVNNLLSARITLKNNATRLINRYSRNNKVLDFTNHP